MKNPAAFLYLCLWLILPALSAGAQTYHYYFGNIHAHSAFSDGNKDKADSHVTTPKACYNFARASQHFDFLGISEHNHSQARMHLASYAKGLAAADSVNEDGRFVCLYGMEYGVIKGGGHVLIYGMNKLIGWESGNFAVFSAKSDYGHLFRLLAANPLVFATLAHPAPTDYNDLADSQYSEVIDKAVCGVAISSGPAFSTVTDYGNPSPIKFYGYYKKLLALGYHIGPTMDHDNHNTTFGRISPTRTVILAQELRRDSLLAAYRANRFYASEDWDTQVDFNINGKPMGSVLDNVKNLKISASVKDPDPGDTVRVMKLFYGKPGSIRNAVVYKTEKGLQDLHLEKTLQNGESLYFFLEITQQDGNRIITSPIWVSTKPAGAAAALKDKALLQASNKLNH